MPVSQKPRHVKRAVPKMNTADLNRRAFLWTGLGFGGLIAAGVGYDMAFGARPPARISGESLLTPLSKDIVFGTSGPVMVEYASYTCPHCAAWHQSVWPEVEKRWVDKGHLRFIFRDYPLDQASLAVAQLVRSLPKEQQRAAISKVFATQTQWYVPGAVGARATELVEHRVPALLNMSPSEARQALRNSALRDEIAGLRLEAERYGIQSTPSFVLPDGKKSAGGASWTQMSAQIEQALKQRP